MVKGPGTPIYWLKPAVPKMLEILVGTGRFLARMHLRGSEDCRVPTVDSWIVVCKCFQLETSLRLVKVVMT